MLAGLAFCEMKSQYPQSAFQGLSGVPRAGQRQFATQTLRVQLLGVIIDFCRSIAAQLPAPRGLSQRKTRGWGHSGEGKTYHKTPPPKTVLNPPTYNTFPPPFVHAMSFRGSAPCHFP